MQSVDRLDHLLRVAPDDPWVRWALPERLDPVAFVEADVLLVPRGGRLPGWWVAPVLGLPDQRVRMERALAALAGHLRASRRSSRGVSLSLPIDEADLTESWWHMEPGARWDWMWTNHRPAVPSGPVVQELDDRADAAELTAFSARHNPRAWAEIGTGRITRWLGVRDEAGHLIAVGGVQAEDSGVPHLTGILVAGQARGRGLGRLISATLTADAVEAVGVCTLGMFTDNDAARRMYESLGYRTARSWWSRRVIAG